MSIYKHLYGNHDDFESTLESTMEVEEMAAEIEDFEEYHEEMVKESALDLAKARGGMYVAEQLIENAMFAAEDHEVEALIEGAIGDFFSKLKENLMKLWNKIKAWFKHVLDTVKRFFMSGKELVKKHKNDITNAASKHSSLEIKCYNWKPRALASKAYAMIGSIEGAAKDKAKEAFNATEDFDMTEAKKSILTKGVGGDKVGEIAKALKSASRPGDKEKHTVGELDINTFMETVTNASEIIKTIEDSNKSVDVAMREAISRIDELSKKSQAKDIENAEKYKKQASNYSELVRYGSTLRTTVVKSFTAEVKTMSRQMTAVLKSLLTKSSAKSLKEGAFSDVYDLLGY